ncbi:Ig-like domain-containing protein [Streptosporangium canum]|uniref:Ig-like domain-containing protein n=1 Tax=Streptosporangium canum TaxID=324952 RepID=UPI0037BDE712
MTTVAMPGGKTVRTYVSSTVVRVNRNGAWHKVDPTLVVENGVIKPRMAKLDIQLSNGGSAAPLLTATGDSLGAKEGRPGKISVAAPGKLPVPELSGSTATYRSAYGRGIDLVVTVTPEGYQHQIVIRERPGERLELPVPIDPPSGMFLGKSSSGKPAALAGGKELADLSTLPVLDAKAIAAPGTGKTSTATAMLTGSGDDTALVLTPDVAFLADPAVTYPVTVAAANPTPWHGAGAPDDTFIANGGSYTSGSYSANSGALFAGRRDGYNYRSYLKFNLTGAPFIGQQIIDANITLWNYISSACGHVGDISLHRIASSWTVNSLKWSEQPLAVADGYVVNPYGKDQNCSDWMAEGELWYSIETIAQAWADGTPNHGVMIRAVGESGANNWRQYLSGNYAGGSDGSHHPYFFVEYEAPARIKGFMIPYKENPTVGDVLDHDYGSSTPQQAPLLTVEEALQAREQAGSYFLEDSKVGFYPPDDMTEEEWHTSIDATPMPTPTPTDVPDTTPPTVIGTLPTAEENNVEVDTEIRVSFSEPVSDAQIEVKRSSGQIVEGTSKMEVSDTVLAFRPSGALPLARFTVVVQGGRDTAGNIMAPHSFGFFTDGTAPKVTAVTPVKDATDVAVSTPISVTFDEATYNTQIAVKDQNGIAIEGSLSADAAHKIWTFQTTQQLAAGVTYEVGVRGGQDAAGNEITPLTWSFKTDGIAPSVTGTSPGADATGVALDSTMNRSGIGGDSMG